MGMGVRVVEGKIEDGTEVAKGLLSQSAACCALRYIRVVVTLYSGDLAASRD